MRLFTYFSDIKRSRTVRDNLAFRKLNEHFNLDRLDTPQPNIKAESSVKKKYVLRRIWFNKSCNKKKTEKIRRNHNFSF